TRDPQGRAGAGAHPTDDDRLAAVDGIAHEHQVGEELQEDADRRQPKQIWPVLSGDCRPEQPLTGADAAAGEDDARTEQPDPDTPTGPRGWGQVANVPRGERAGFDLRADVDRLFGHGRAHGLPARRSVGQVSQPVLRNVVAHSVNWTGWETCPTRVCL